MNTTGFLKRMRPKGGSFDLSISRIQMPPPRGQQFVRMTISGTVRKEGLLRDTVIDFTTVVRLRPVVEVSAIAVHALLAGEVVFMQTRVRSGILASLFPAEAQKRVRDGFGRKLRPGMVVFVDTLGNYGYYANDDLELAARARSPGQREIRRAYSARKKRGGAIHTGNLMAVAVSKSPR